MAITGLMAGKGECVAAAGFESWLTSAEYIGLLLPGLGGHCCSKFIVMEVERQLSRPAVKSTCRSCEGTRV